MSLEMYHPGLDGVIAGETNISCVEGEMLYRGFSVMELAEEASYLEVAHLLLTEELPTQEQLADFRSLLWDDAVLPEPVRRFVHDLPLHVSAVEMLRTGVSLLGNYEPQQDDCLLETGVSQSIRLMSHVPLLLGEWARQRDGLPAVEPSPVLTYPGNLLLLLTGEEPAPEAELALTAALILHADDALTTSSFAARVATSNGASLVSSVTAAIGTCAGPQFSEQYSPVQQVLATVGSRDEAERWVRYRVGESLPIPGFGPPGEIHFDPRAALLGRRCTEFANTAEGQHLEEIADAIEWSVREQTSRTPTLIWPTARLFDAIGVDRDLHPLLFLCGRLPGWCAHIIEQAEEGDVIRPRSRYRGAERGYFEPLMNRG